MEAEQTASRMYRRAALDCYLITALKRDKYLGRTKIEKISHLMEYHCGVALERVPLRDAAGPNDYQSRMKVESLARRQNLYSTRTAADKLKVDYLPVPKSPNPAELRKISSASASLPWMRCYR